MTIAWATFGWDLVLALHILCVVVWVGGMFFAYAVLHPALAGLDGPPRIALQGRVMKRFFLIVWHAMPLVILSGYGMLFGVYGGFKDVGWPIHAMNGLGLIMAAIFIFLFTGPWRRFRAAVQPARAATAGAAIRRLIGINLLLGFATIIFASLAHWGF
jgi:uncharacterized membrane protein